MKVHIAEQVTDDGERHIAVADSRAAAFNELRRMTRSKFSYLEARADVVNLVDTRPRDPR